MNIVNSEFEFGCCYSTIDFSKKLSNIIELPINAYYYRQCIGKYICDDNEMTCNIKSAEENVFFETSPIQNQMFVTFRHCDNPFILFQ